MIYPGSSYRKLPRPATTWLIEPIIPAGGSVVLYGDAKLGKSFLALQAAEAIVSGTDWLCYPTRIKNGKVVYIQLDTPRGLWMDRIDSLAPKHPNLDIIDYADRETLDFPFDILNPEHFSHLQQDLSTIKPDLVIFDTLREAHAEEENSSTDMKNVIAALTACVRPAALLLVSHPRKPQPESLDSLLSGQRGSGYIVGKMDTIIKLNPHSLQAVGRALEEVSIDIERMENGYWHYDSDLPYIQEILSLDHSMSEKAEIVAQKLHISKEAARSKLRRAAK